MSDITEVAGILSHHTLECLAFQFDGTDPGAVRIVGVLHPELQMRAAEITAANFRADSERAHFAVTIERLADGAAWAERLNRGEWLVIWLHKEFVHWVEKMPQSRGEILFEPVTPVIKIEQARRHLTALD